MRHQIPKILESLSSASSGAPGLLASEAEYREQWGRALDNERSPQSLALAGGYLASQLPWVFLAGYQAAIRWVFADASIAGWLAFAASEDRGSENPLPGVRRGDNGALAGWKTWVAGVNSIDGLLVLLNRDGSVPAKVVELSRATQGLTLHGPGAAPSAGRFLGAMSQGKAQLADVPLVEQRELSTERLRWFRHAEAISVFTALAAFLLRQSEIVAHDGLRNDVAELFAGQARAFELADETALADASRDIAANTIACAQRYEGIAGERVPGNWAVDRRLITMYAPRN